MVTSNDVPVITFIVPCYNYGRYLGDCLNSIIALRGEQRFEVIVIDDASTDDTRQVVGGFNDDRLRVITHQVNQGHARTINEGLREARGEFVARIDPDDRYRPDFLEATLDKFARHPEVGLVYGDAALIDEEGTITAPSSDVVHRGADFKGNELIALLRRNFICAPTVIARRRAWLEAGPVPEWLAFNDWYFTLMIARHWEFYYVNRVVADYRIHAANHHSAIVANRTEEPSLFWVLDNLYNDVEPDAALDLAKRRVRRSIYAAHYVTLADKYFGFDMFRDARRCYVRAVGRTPRAALSPDLLRHLLGTIMGVRTYSAARAVVPGLVRRGARTARTEAGSPAVTMSKHDPAASSAPEDPHADRSHRWKPRFLLRRVEQALIAIRHSAWLDQQRWLWDLARPAHDRVTAVLGRRGLLRVINGIDPVLISPEVRGISDSYEPVVWRRIMAEIRPGDVVADVGAFIGLYAVAFARHVTTTGTVFAFEPDPANFGLLQRHAQLNRVLDRMNLFPTAVGTINADISFETGDGCESHIGHDAGTDGSSRVPCVTLDAVFAATRLDVLKIDVEGYEEHVLRGASGLLADHHRAPRAIFIEVHPYAWDNFGTTIDSLLNLLKRHQYQVVDCAGNSVQRIDSYGEIIALSTRGRSHAT